MTFKQRILLKWIAVVSVCGAHSFFWGLSSNGSVIGMLAGMATLVAGFYALESHPRFQHARSASAALHKALLWGLRIRIVLAVLILAPYIINAAIQSSSTQRNFIDFIILPASCEMFIGAVAISVTDKTLGISLSPIRQDSSARHERTEKSIIATYITTLITSAMHSVILAFIMAFCFAYFKIRQKMGAA